MAAMEQASLGVVSLAPGLIYAAYPSKTIMYLEMGCRMLAIVEEESALASLVRTENLGATAEPNNPENIAEALARTLGTEWGAPERDRAQSVARREFSADSVLPRWHALLSSEDSA